MPTVNEFPTSEPRIDGDVVFQRMSDGAILLSTEDEVYFGLNEVGAEIWKRLEQDRSLEAICDDLRDRYPEVDGERIRSDVEDLLQALSREGLVSWSGAGAADDGE